MGAAKKYAYRSIREGSEVFSVYLGPTEDPVVRVINRHAELVRASAAAEDALVGRELEISDWADRCLCLVAIISNRNVRNLRKRRNRARDHKLRRATLEPSQTIPMTCRQYDELVATAATGNEEALAQLRGVLEANPMLYELLGDINEHVRRQLIAVAAGTSVDVQESLKLMIAEQQERLLQAGHTPPEQMLVEQVLTTMLDVGIQRIALAQPHRKQSIVRRLEQQLRRSLDRHLAAVKALVEVRQMLTD